MATIDLDPGAIQVLEWELTSPEPMFHWVMAHLEASIRDDLTVEGEKITDASGNYLVNPAEWSLFNMLLILEASED
jgi:hypothetical protein